MLHKIGERIANHRKENKMSQEEVASLLGVSRQTISKWETADTLPDIYNAVALARLYHLSLDELVLGVPSMRGKASYTEELKETRRKANIRAMVVGGIGSTTFALSIVLLDAFDVAKRDIGLTMIFIFPILMCCWGFAIWNFIKIGRINDEIKYLQSMELLNIRSQPIGDMPKT
jgi:transcriptional regulator with XRE-family HTH domain